MRYAASALRYVMFCQLSSGAFAVRQKSLLALLPVARIIPVGPPLSPRVGPVQAKSRRSPVGPAALLFYVRVALPAIAAGWSWDVKVMLKPHATALISMLATIHAFGLVPIKTRSTHCDGNSVAQKQAR